MKLFQFGIRTLFASALILSAAACGQAPLPLNNLQMRRTLPMQANFRRMTNHLPPEAPPLPDAERLEIRLFRTYGSPQEIKIRARTIEYESTPPHPNDSSWRVIMRNLLGLSHDEEDDVKVRFSLNGKAVYAVSDDEGMIRLNTRDFGPLQPGQYPLTAEVAGGQEYSAEAVTIPLYIHDAQTPSLGIISDIDDTVKHMNVRNKWAAAKKLFLQSPFEAQEIPGTPLLYQILEERIDGQTDDGDIFYLSGSPLNFAPQIYAYLDHKRFPKGSVTLKKWGFGSGSDNPLVQSDYKLRNIREIFQAYPQRQFLLFGDSGEADAEIYKKIAAEFPGRVKGIFINNVTQDSPSNPKFKGVHLTRNSLEAAVILQQMGVLEAEDVGAIQQALKGH